MSNIGNFMSVKRKVVELEDDYSSYPEKDLKKELRIVGKYFKEIDGKYYLNDQLINEIIEENDLDTVSINFVMDDKDNKFIRYLSPQIKKLRLVRYGDPIDNLPDQITHLETGGVNYPITKLPKFLTYLWIDDNFTSTIKEYPENLRFLKLSKNAVFNADKLPDKLVYLEIPKAKCVDNLPQSITYLKIVSNVSVDNLPESLIYLKLGAHNNYTIDNFNLPIDNLPISIKKLELGSKFNHPINNLPNGLEELQLGENFNLPIDNLPSTLQKLELGENFNQSINNLPINLGLLILGKNFNQPISNLNPNLKVLKLGCNFNQQITSLPNSLESITFNSYYTQPLDNLPEKLKTIYINIYYYRNFDENQLTDDRLVTIHYKTGLKKVVFTNLNYRLEDFKFHLKIKEQIYQIDVNKNEIYQKTFDYDNKKKLYVKIEYKKTNDNFLVELNLK